MTKLFNPWHDKSVYWDASWYSNRKFKTIDKHFIQRKYVWEFINEFNYCAIRYRTNSKYYKINNSKFLQVLGFIKLNFDLYEAMWFQGKRKKSVTVLKYFPNTVEFIVNIISWYVCHTWTYSDISRNTL